MYPVFLFARFVLYLEQTFHVVFYDRIFVFFEGRPKNFHKNICLKQNITKNQNYSNTNKKNKLTLISNEHNSLGPGLGNHVTK